VLIHAAGPVLIAVAIGWGMKVTRLRADSPLLAHLVPAFP
jgi:hypothetical protein